MSECGTFKLRYRISLHTDERLRWWASIEWYSDNPNRGPSLRFTSTWETWAEAFQQAQQMIDEDRTSGIDT